MRRGEEVPYHGGDDEPQSAEKKTLQGIVFVNSTEDMRWVLKMGGLSDKLAPSYVRRLPSAMLVSHPTDELHRYAQKDARKYERVRRTRRRLAMGSTVMCLLAGTYGLATFLTDQARIDPPLLTETDASYTDLAAVAGDPQKLRQLKICARDVLMQSYYQSELVKEGRLMADRQAVNSAAYITAIEAKLPCYEKLDEDVPYYATLGEKDNKRSVHRNEMVGEFWSTNWAEDREGIINQSYAARGTEAHDLQLMLSAGDQATHFVPAPKGVASPSVMPLTAP